ncbi:MAG: hypothetical protein H6658_10020 [Ardenticatenaceae bacterium]|nr:hypothetical protein [Ardenticatenaceae bacterium]
MNSLTHKLGYWSAWIGAVTFIIFTICFMGVLATAPLFTWTNLADYVSYAQANGQFWPTLARLSMLAFAPTFVVLLNCLHDIAPPDKKLLTRLSVQFGLLFAGVVSVHYFVQVTAVRLSLQNNQLTGLEQIVQANPISAISAINMLGFTLFLGLASLFGGLAFNGGKWERVLRYAFLLNGVFMLAGGLGYILQINLLIFFTLNFGMGGALLVVFVAAMKLFRPSS